MWEDEGGRKEKYIFVCISSLVFVFHMGQVTVYSKLTDDVQFIKKFICVKSRNCPITVEIVIRKRYHFTFY